MLVNDGVISSADTHVADRWVCATVATVERAKLEIWYITCNCFLNQRTLVVVLSYAERISLLK